MRSFGLALLPAALLGTLALTPAMDERKPQDITITITRDSVTISPSRVTAGQATLRVTNNAAAPYEFEIDGPGVDEEINDIPSGSTSTLTVTLRRGRYRIETEAETGPKNQRITTLVVE